MTFEVSYIFQSRVNDKVVERRRMTNGWVECWYQRIRKNPKGEGLHKAKELLSFSTKNNKFKVLY